MSRLLVTMAMSLDGLITSPHDDAQNLAGMNGMRPRDRHARTSTGEV
jgi:hypothetical protein